VQLAFQLLIYYLVLSILLYGSLAINPRMWLHRMPPAVVAKVPPKTAYEKKILLTTTAIPFLLLLLAYPVIYVLRKEGNWLSYFGILCAFFLGFDLWDTLILDLLIFCKLTPRFIIIAGTNRADYADMRYHLVSGFKGLVLSIAFSGVLATILYFTKVYLT
jgi:hypothetical protein